MLTGLSSDYIQSVFQDREGNIWVGTFGKGLSRLIDDFFTFYEHDPKRYGTSVSAVFISENDHWFGVENGLVRISSDPEEIWKFYTDTTGFVNDKVTSIHQIDSSLWIGTGIHGIYRMDLWNEKIRRINWNYSSLENRINQIQGSGDELWIATDGGLINYNIKTKDSKIFNTEDRLPHNSIKALLQDGENFWFGTRDRHLYRLSASGLRSFEISQTGDIEVVDLCKDKSGNIWVATDRTGVYLFKNQEFKNYSSKHGLKSNYCYAIQPDAIGNIWVGHRGALSKIDTKTDEIEIFDHKSGIDEQVNSRAMFLDSKNYLWIGTNGGAVKYDPSKDSKNMVAPVVNLLRLIIDDKEYEVGENIDLPYGNYRVEFEFIGISFSKPEEVTYQFMLEGYDGVFSNPTKAPTATYGRLADGEYTFRVIACNADGICSETEANIVLSIGKPFWKTWWFGLVVILTLALTVFFIIKIRTRRLRATQIFLEHQLEIKTKEVVDKANQIEEINKNLTSSINYAERIQNAILPKDEELSDNLLGSFIFFRPRDIVSGDFYYVEKIDNKLIVVCADCTGHGVPGAFMSMIGSVSIRNIYEIMELTGQWKTPEKVLADLDFEIETVLKQKEEEDMDPGEAFLQSKDGIDLTICEINLDTYEVLIAAAMRTSIIRQGDSIRMIKGDQKLIGGGDQIAIDFDLQRFQMKKGDGLYLFTDGYSDQFGGPNGRKLKLNKVEQIVEELAKVNYKEHRGIVEGHFDNWKGDYDQIDDVLFMGLVF